MERLGEFSMMWYEKKRSKIHLKTSNDGTHNSFHYYSKRMRMDAKFNSLLSLTHCLYRKAIWRAIVISNAGNTRELHELGNSVETVQPQLDQIIEANSNTRLIKIYWCLPNEQTNLLLLFFSWVSAISLRSAIHRSGSSDISYRPHFSTSLWNFHYAVQLILNQINFVSLCILKIN